MKYSKATNYALHTMLYFVMVPEGKVVGVQTLAEMMKISPTYLSKILTRLVKAGLIESTPGAHGGYALLGQKSDVSFLKVINAIEGTVSLFSHDMGPGSEKCLIQQTMVTAEHVMESYLEQKKLADLVPASDEEDLSKMMHTLS